MRDDMFKVIVERPRWGSRMRLREGRAYRNGEDVPGKVGMKKGYTHRKALNENLAPLKRWLESQVNRPWDKVYAELCANIDRRSTVQEHIFSHIDDFVERKTRLVDGEVYAAYRWSRELQPIKGSSVKLYVHPKTGVLCFNKHRVTWRQAREEKRNAAKAEIAVRRRDIDDTEQLHKLDGVWYHVTLVPMDQGRPYHDSKTGLTELAHPKHWDVVRKQMVSRNRHKAESKPDAEMLFGKRYVYASEKRQLSNAELRLYELTNEVNETNDNAGDSRRFCFHLRKNFRMFFATPPNRSIDNRVEQNRIRIYGHHDSHVVMATSDQPQRRSCIHAEFTRVNFQDPLAWKKRFFFQATAV